MRPQMLSATIFCFSLIASFDDKPKPRHLEQITYDKERDRLLLFGGAEIISGKVNEPNSLYEWTGADWNRVDAAGPIGRRGHGWIYDESIKETILIGGVATGKLNPDSVLYDVWTWNGKQWKKNDQRCPVKEPLVAYDPIERRTFVYGEVSNKGQIKYDGERKFELWQLKSGSWKILSNKIPEMPGARAISFDEKRRRLFIPVYQDEQLTVWEWTKNTWEKKLCNNSFPEYRSRFALAYNPVDNCIYLFGGLDKNRLQLGDFWKWNGEFWKQVETDGKPDPRNSAHLAFCDDEMILYGGSVPKTPPEKGIELSNQIWRWKNNTWQLLN